MISWKVKNEFWKLIKYFSVTMKVNIGDIAEIVSELKGLFQELPEDLRPTDEVLQASHLICEAKE